MKTYCTRRRPTWQEESGSPAFTAAPAVRRGTVRPLRAAVLGVCVAALGGGAGSGCEAEKPKEFVAPPPPQVTVAEPVVMQVDDSLEFTGTTRAGDSVEVRARVEGFIDKRHFEGGQRIKAGDLLYTIDPRQFQAAVDQAKAELAARDAALRIAQVTLERAKVAAEQGATNPLEIERLTGERDAAAAQVDLSKARLDRANLDLEYTLVRSPISGRLGTKYLDVGQLVGRGEATLMATVLDDSIVYAGFSMDERTLLSLRRRFAHRRPGEDGRLNLPILLAKAGDEDFPHAGVFHSADNMVDASTGTIWIEAKFDNPDGAILAGLFVRLRLVYGMEEAMLVPEACILQDQAGRFVYVAGADGTVERRGITVGRLEKRMRRVLEGLEPADQVIVNGVQRARPGAKVTPMRQTPPAPAPAAAPAPATPAGQPSKPASGPGSSTPASEPNTPAGNAAAR